MPSLVGQPDEGSDGAAGGASSGDGQTVSRAALVEQLEKQSPALALREEPGVSGTAIFTILDADGDRRLSRAELHNAQRLLLRRDFNDDQAIAADELIEDPRVQAREEGPAAVSSTGAGRAGSGSVILLRSDTTDREIAANLLARYDRNRDGRVSVTGSAAEAGLEAAALEATSPDKSGAIAAEELARLCRGIDVEVPVALGSGGAAARSSARAAARKSDGAFKIRQRLTGDLKVEGAGIELNLRRDNRNPLRNSGREVSLAEYDADGNGYLDQAESQQAPLLANAFAQMDGNHDGKVFPPEFEAYMRRQARAAGSRLVLRVTDLGQDLFDQLDTTPDNQLSVREILAAVKLLETADRNGDGYLAGDEIAQRLEWELARGTAELAETRAMLARTMPRSPMMADQRAGPKWFAAMDRNQDGDLSAEEFVGPPEAFQRLDKNHDGLIDAEEAAAAVNDRAQ